MPRQSRTAPEYFVDVDGSIRARIIEQIIQQTENQTDTATTTYSTPDWPLAEDFPGATQEVDTSASATHPADPWVNHRSAPTRYLNRTQSVRSRCTCPDPVPPTCRTRRCSNCQVWQSQEQNFYRSSALCKECYRERYRPSRHRGRSPLARTFGVEIEMTDPSYWSIQNAFDRAGVSLRYVGEYRSSSGAQWELKTDSSVDGHGWEIATPILAGQPGLDRLKEVMAQLNRVNARANSSCGLHVHVGMRGMSARDIRKQVLAYLDRQWTIGRMLAASRRNNYDACPPWDPWAITSFRESPMNTVRNLRRGPRGNINLYSYPRHGTVEVRQHGGTVWYAKMAAWIKFLLCLFQAALDDRIDEVPGTGDREQPDEMLDALHAMYPDVLKVGDVRILRRFVSDREGVVRRVRTTRA